MEELWICGGKGVYGQSLYLPLFCCESKTLSEKEKVFKIQKLYSAGHFLV